MCDCSYGLSGCDSIYRLSGCDSIYGLSGCDCSYGLSGCDCSYGLSGCDSIYGLSGCDYSYGLMRVKERKFFLLKRTKYLDSETTITFSATVIVKFKEVDLIHFYNYIFIHSL